MGDSARRPVTPAWRWRLVAALPPPSFPPPLSLSLSPQDHPTPPGGHLSRRSRRRFASAPAGPDGSTPRRAESVAMQAGKAAGSREGGRPLQLTMKRGYEVLRDPHLNKVGAGASPLPSAACLRAGPGRAVPGSSPPMEPAAGLCLSPGSPFLASYSGAEALEEDAGGLSRAGVLLRCQLRCFPAPHPQRPALLPVAVCAVRPPRVPEGFCHRASAPKSKACSP